MGLFIGAIIGGGIFSLPFVFAQVGLLKGLLYLVAVTILMTVTYLMYADVILKTPGKHNFVSLNKLYLGEVGEFLGIIVSVLIIILVLFIYLVLASRFMGLIFWGPDWITVVPFWFFASLAIFFNIRKLAVIEFLTSLLIALIIIIIFFWSLSYFSLESFKIVFDGKYMPGLFWLPIGPLIFALSGRAGVLELISYSKKNVFKTIINSFFFVSMIYLLFILAILLLTGGVVSDDAISSLSGHLPVFILALLAIMGLLALWHVYIILGFDARNILAVDLGWPKITSSILIIFIPILLYLLGWNNFLILVSLVGGIFAALENILIILMWFKIKKYSIKRFWGYLAFTVFFIILIHELIERLYA